MIEKIYLLLVILCGIICQEIIANLSDGGPSDLLVREKRVINLDQEGYGQTNIENANYITTIKENNMANCIGVILSHYTIITSALCVQLQESMYRVISGSAYAHKGFIHRISSKVTHYGNPPYGSYDGIALLAINPPFTFDQKTGNIHLYAGPVRAGTEATVSGWGTCNPFIPSTSVQRRLRQINIPIMNHTECENEYRNQFPVTRKFICTYHERKFCATSSDLGAPLVINNKLAGIHIYKSDLIDHKNPDLFVDLQLPEYNVWIRRNARFI